jgi:hypothetical protein
MLPIKTAGKFRRFFYVKNISCKYYVYICIYLSANI